VTCSGGLWQEGGLVRVVFILFSCLSIICTCWVVSCVLHGFLMDLFFGCVVVSYSVFV
jgi:hypothetical protein